jgi:hypothetical protein
MKKATAMAATTLCLLVAAVSIITATQKPEPKAAAGISVEQILDNYVAALGGRDALEKIKSRVSKGTVEVVGVERKGTVEVYEKAPNKVAHLVQIPGLFVSHEGFNGSVGWSVEAKSRRVAEKKGAELEAAKYDSDFYQPLNFKARYPKLALKGTEKIKYRDGERETYVVAAVSALGDAETFYFDAQNNLLIRHDYVERDDDGEQQVREFLLDYKDVDGVKVPFTTRQAQSEAIFIIRLSEVSQNVAIDDAKFDKPASGTN